MGVQWDKVIWGVFCFVFWKITELLGDTPNRNVNTMLTVCSHFFPL